MKNTLPLLGLIVCLSFSTSIPAQDANTYNIDTFIALVDKSINKNGDAMVELAQASQAMLHDDVLRRNFFTILTKYYQVEKKEEIPKFVLTLYKEAAELKHAGAQLFWGKLYLPSIPDFSTRKDFGPYAPKPDIKKAETWLDLAATGDDTDAKVLLRQVRESETVSINGVDMVDLRRFYNNDGSIKPSMLQIDFVKEIEAAKGGNADSFYKLAEVTIAAIDDQNVQGPFLAVLKQHYPIRQERDLPVYAIYFMEQAAKFDHVEAMFFLGEMNLPGAEIKDKYATLLGPFYFHSPDTEKAKSYLQQAAEKDYEPAKLLLRQMQ